MEARSVLQRRSDVVGGPRNGELVLFDERTGARHVLSQSAAALWPFCDGVRPLGEVATALAETAGVDPAAVERDLVGAAHDLIALGVLEVASRVARVASRPTPCPKGLGEILPSHPSTSTAAVIVDIEPRLLADLLRRQFAVRGLTVTDPTEPTAPAQHVKVALVGEAGRSVQADAVVRLHEFGKKLPARVEIDMAEPGAPRVVTVATATELIDLVVALATS